MYETFFKPYIAKHETEIDRNLLELRTRAGDMAVVYFQRVANYVQTRSYEILQYIASQSPSQRPRPQVLLPWLPFLPAIRNILATRVVTPAMRSMYVPKCSLPSTWGIRYLSSSSVWHSSLTWVIPSFWTVIVLSGRFSWDCAQMFLSHYVAWNLSCLSKSILIYWIYEIDLPKRTLIMLLVHLVADWG